VSAAFNLGSEASAAQAAGETGNAGTPGQAERERLASAIRDLFGADCPNEPCPQCARREAELMDLADDYAATGGLDSAPADDYAKLRKERDGLRGQLQAVRRLMADAMANGMIDSQAILDQLNAAPAEPQPAPELAAATAQARLYLDALTTLRDVLLRDGDHLAARRHALQVIDSLELPS
jgi:hypothetical protein